MKTHDLSAGVMEKVVRFEKRRTGQWVAVFFLVAVGLGAAFLAAAWFFAQELVERQALELLTLFGQDREIIAEFWQDTLVVFWEELPHEWLLFGLLILFTILSVWFFTRARRRKIARIRQQLERYEKKRYSNSTKRRGI